MRRYTVWLDSLPSEAANQPNDEAVLDGLSMWALGRRWNAIVRCDGVQRLYECGFGE